MITKIFLFMLGYALTLIGLLYIISYLNLLSLGYNFLEYVYFIIRRIECIYVVIGICLMIFSVSIGGKYELYI